MSYCMIACMALTPLAHKRILLTRSMAHITTLDAHVRARGGVPILLPCLQVEYLKDAIHAALATHELSTDVVFTSANGVHAVATQISMSALCDQKRVAAVGEKTAKALAQYGVLVDVIPSIASQDGLIAAYERLGLPKSLLFFRAQQGRDVLINTLALKGVSVRLAKVYRTVCPQNNASDGSRVIDMMQHDHIDAVLLGSTKTVRFYIQRIGSVVLADRPVLVVISESVADAARKMGLGVQVVAKQASFEAMLDALAEYFDFLRSV